MPKNYHTPIDGSSAYTRGMLRYAITGGHTSSSATGARPPTPLDAHSPSLGYPLFEQVRALAKEGVEFVQLREKHLSAAELACVAREILSILRAWNAPTRLLINGRADVALAAGAHGVHLPSTPGGLAPAQIRGLYAALGRTPPTISMACHTRCEVRSARALCPDLILFSPVFGKTIHFTEGRHELPGTGLEELARACELAHPIPVLALGGVTPDNTAACLAAGAAGVAGIRLFER